MKQRAKERNGVAAERQGRERKTWKLKDQHMHEFKDLMETELLYDW